MSEVTGNGPRGSTVNEAAAALSARFSAPVEEEVVQEQEQEVEEVVEQDLDEVETGVEPEEVETEEAEEDHESSDEGLTFSRVDDLLEAGGVTSDGISVTVKINGEEREVTLDEAIRGYQRQADYDRLMSQVRESQAQISQQKENIFQDPEVQDKFRVFDETFAMAQSVLQGDENAMIERYRSIDWDKVRAEEPERYAVMQADFNRENQELRERQQKLKESYEAANIERRKNADAHMNKTRVTERARLIERIPEWADQTTLEQGANEVAQYLVTQYGATEQELMSMVDHRIIDIARKARLYDQLQSAGQTALKKKKGKVSPTLRPGANKGAVNVRRKAKLQDESRQKLAGSHKVEDAVEALKMRFGNR